MNCLLCNFFDSTGRTDEELIEHYLSYHKIDPENYFFLGLFKGENGLFCKECIRCNEFLTTKAEIKKHNFLKHYLVGEQKPAEFKPIDLIRNKDITIYQISFAKHSEEYNFFDTEVIVYEFFFNVKNLFVPSKPVLFKANFTIENNHQSAPIGFDNTTEIKSYWYWFISTNVYKAIYLNDFIAARMQNDILIWRFNRFTYLNLKTVEKSNI